MELPYRSVLRRVCMWYQYVRFGRSLKLEPEQGGGGAQSNPFPPRHADPLSFLCQANNALWRRSTVPAGAAASMPSVQMMSHAPQRQSRYGTFRQLKIAFSRGERRVARGPRRAKDRGKGVPVTGAQSMTSRLKAVSLMAVGCQLGVSRGWLGVSPIECQWGAAWQLEWTSGALTPST